MSEPSPYPSAADVLANLYRVIGEHRGAGLAPIAELKVTREQLGKIRDIVPVDLYGIRPYVAMLIFSVPVVLVDTEEESTLFTMTWESLVRRLGGRP